MRHQYHAAGKINQIVLQPAHRLRIEMVGRFIHQEHIRLGQQQLANRYPPHFPTRKLRHIGIIGRTAQRFHRHLDLGIDIPCVRRIHLLLERRHLLHQFIRVLFAKSGRNDIELVEDLLFGALVRNIIEHIHALIQLRLLRQIANLDPFSRPRFAIKLLVHPRHNLEQRRFTRAIDPNDPDLGIR